MRVPPALTSRPPTWSCWTSWAGSACATGPLRALAATPMVLGALGDLNATPWLRPLGALRAAAGLADSLEGHGVQPSWPADLPWIARIPIDLVLHSFHLATEARTLGRFVGSDHRPVFVRLGFR